MASDLNIGPAGPAGAIPTSRALTRVTPVSPHAPAPDGSPLDRSGLDVRELVTTADHVVVRARTPAIALDMGLEQARGSMVRNQPADALAMLDQVWSGARHTETGWYLRASSLALLGLPIEAARVASDAIDRNPQSSANLFLLSLAKLTLGELNVARQSIAEAIGHRGPDALLLVQSALLEAQAGNVSEAKQLLRRVTAEWPEHPALGYGRRMIGEVMHATRDGRFTPAAGIGVLNTPTHSTALLPDAVADSLETLGAALREGTEYDAIVVARDMLSSLSSGGALANATAPARAHVLRTLLTSVLATLKSPGHSGSVGWASENDDGQWQRATSDTPQELESRNTRDAHSPLTDTVRAVVRAMRDGRLAEAETLLRRAHGALDNTTLALLRSIVGEPAALEQSDRRRRGAPSPVDVEVAETHVGVHDADPSLLAPIRLGLALLPPSDLYNHALNPMESDDRNVSYATLVHPSGAAAEDRTESPTEARSVLLIVAAGVFALGVLSFATGHPLLGLGLGAAGVWVALKAFAPAGTQQEG